ncbi:hypothetical protein ABIC37_005431 [Priestia megaterium]|uniref:hypothetical protein n=1 Tax=Priestia megaterium TaxID=1404 RepID=UPI003399FF0E
MSDLIQLPVRVQAEQMQPEESEQTLEKINRFTLEPVQSTDDLFLFSGIASNDRLDAYFTRMDPMTTLKNYVSNLREGVSLQGGHDITKNPFGRSYDAQFLTSHEENAVLGHWYMIRDLNINGENTNDLIRAVKGGILKDLSVGFGGNEMYHRCSSCGKDLFDYECPHFPGLEDENGRMVFAWIVNATLREVSTVYKGATPGAYVSKARSYVDQGQLSKNHIARLENAYSTRLDDGKHSFYLPKGSNEIVIPLGGEKENKRNEEADKMGEQERTYYSRNNLLGDIRQAVRDNKIEKAAIYEVLGEEGDKFRQPEDIKLRNELGKDFCSVDAVRQLKKEAQQGRRYLADVIEDAVKARVRAFGDGFNAESYRAMLTTSGEIDHIKEEIDAYERMAKERFKPGRQTEPEKVPGEEQGEEENKRFEPVEDGNLFDGGEE